MLEQLIDVLALQADGEDRYLGHNMHPKGFRVYGGQVLAQALNAAQYSVQEGRVVHSQHANFLREGDAGKSIDYQVERARDGGSFSSRRVVALQDGQPILGDMDLIYENILFLLYRVLFASFHINPGDMLRLL